MMNAITEVQHGSRRQASRAGLAAILVLLSRWAVLAPIFGNPEDIPGRMLLGAVDYARGIAVAVAILVGLVSAALAVRDRYEHRATQWARLLSRPSTLIMTVPVASVDLMAVSAVVLAHLVEGRRTRPLSS